MEETILNLYLVIEKNYITEFRAVAYQVEGSDDEKIALLKSRVTEDFYDAEIFNSPSNKNGKPMSYRQFSKLESQGKQFHFFEEIFQHFEVPKSPLVCLTPVMDGKILN